MFCDNCGYKLDKDTKFCPRCGAPAFDDSDVQDEADEYDDSYYDEADGMEEGSVPVWDTDNSGSYERDKRPVKRKKSFGINPRIIAAAVVAVIVVVLVFAGINILKSRGSGSGRSSSRSSGRSNSLICYSNGSLRLIDDFTKKNIAFYSISDIRGDNNTIGSTKACLTDDMKYLYFFNKIDNDDGYGTLCRVEISKLGKDAVKNEKRIVEIDTKVRFFSGIDQILEDDSLLYFKNNGRLMYFDGKKSEEVDSGVSDIRKGISEKEMFYTKRKNDGKYDIYWVNLNKPAGAVKMISSAADVDFNYLDKGIIIYYKIDSANAKHCYYYDYESEIDYKLPDRSTIYGMTEGKDLYYGLERDGGEYTLYSFVNDPYAQSDISEYPTIRGYLIDTNDANAFTDGDVEEINSRYKGNAKSFIMNNWEHDRDTGLYTVYIAERGKEYCYDPDNNKIYEINRGEYENAKEQYEASRVRIELRDRLKNENISVTFHDLYRLRNGVEEPVCENLIRSVIIDKDTVFYRKGMGDIPKVDIDDITGPFYVRNKIMRSLSNYDYEWEYRTGGGEEKPFSVDGIFNGLYRTEKGDIFYVQSYDKDEDEYFITRYAQSGKEIKKGDRIAEEARIAGIVGDDLYYCDNFDSDEADLYRYSNGKSQMIARGIESVNMQVHDDGVFTFMDHGENNGYRMVYDLEMINNKLEKNRIDYDVTDYLYYSKNKIIYKQDDDLYYYNGKDRPSRIATDVTYFMGINVPDKDNIYVFLGEVEAPATEEPAEYDEEYYEDYYEDWLPPEEEAAEYYEEDYVEDYVEDYIEDYDEDYEEELAY